MEQTQKIDWDILLKQHPEFDSHIIASCRAEQKKQLETEAQNLISQRAKLRKQLDELSGTDDVTDMLAKNKESRLNSDSTSKWAKTQPDIVKLLKLQKDLKEIGKECSALNKKSSSAGAGCVINFREKRK